jgi:hypothetical protein
MSHASRDATPVTPPSVCPSCRAVAEGGDETCTACGAPLLAPDDDITEVDESGSSASSIPPDDKTAAALQRALRPNIELVRRLGSGGMSTVYLGRDATLRRFVAIKVLSKELANDPLARARFTREAEAAAGIVDPHVVDVYQVGHLPRTKKPYLVMQFVDGPTVEQMILSEDVMPELTARAVVGEVATALAAAHARGVLHRDIKPSNIVIDRETGETMVVDFGISAALRAGALTNAEEITLDGVAPGTPAYMSPEQAAARDLTDRSDVYSLGVVAFELLTGRKPFQADAPEGYMAAHLQQPPPDLRAYRPDVDPFFAGLVNRCLNKNPSARPAAAALARAILRRTREPVEWPPPGLRRMRSTGWRLLGSLGAAATAAVTFAVALWLPTTGIWPNSPSVGPIQAAALTVLLVVIGLSAATAMVRARRLLTHWRAARTVGYPVDILLDVALDHRSDTPAVLNASGPYALLTTTQRQWLLRLTRIRGAVLCGVVLYAACYPLWWLMTLRAGATRVTIFDGSDLAHHLLPPAAGIAVAAALAVPQWLARHRFQFWNLFRNIVQLQRPVPASSVPRWLATVGRTLSPPQPRPEWFPWVTRGAFALSTLVSIALLMGLMGALTVTSVSRRWSTPAGIAGAAPSPDRTTAADLAVSLPPMEIDSQTSGPAPGTAVLASLAAGPTAREALRLIGDSDVRAPVRWWAVSGLVTGFCGNSVEVLLGVDPGRADLLAQAGALAKDLPDIRRWIALQQHRLDQWHDDPASATTARAVPFLLKPLRFLGFKGFVARLAYCRTPL